MITNPHDTITQAIIDFTYQAIEKAGLRKIQPEVEMALKRALCSLVIARKSLSVEQSNDLEKGMLHLIS